MSQPTLAGLLRKLGAEYAAETPALEHAVAETDDGGAPVMGKDAQGYLGFLPSNACVFGHKFCKKHAPRDDQPDNWRWTACQVSEGRYRTPVRCAIERIGPDGRDAEGKPVFSRRLFVRDLLANTLFPSEIAEAHGIPRWAANEVIYQSLSIVGRLYREFPEQERSRPGYVSDSQRNAEDAA